MNKKQEQMMVLFQDLSLAFIINSAATIIAGFTTIWEFLFGMFLAFTINYIAGLIIPVSVCGNAVANFLHCKKGGFLHSLVRIFIINAIYVTIISFTIALIRVGAKVEVFEIWWQSYWILHLVGFVASVLLERGCINLAKILVKD